MVFRLAAFVAAILIASVTSGDRASASPQSPALEAGIDEKLGATIPLDLSFTDEQGRSVVLRDLINKPTVLMFVYFRCSHVCPALLSGVSDVLSRIELVPGKDFNLLTVSFDENDTPAVAAQKKQDYVKASGRNFPGHSWDYLTGNEEAIGKLTSAAGFKFRRTADGFAHPVAIILLSPEGKITRYLYGVRFLPMDLTLAITEASKGLAVPTVRKVLMYCYSYDPEGRRYVFNVLKVTAAATIFFIALFIGWLTLWGRKGRKGT